MTLHLALAGASLLPGFEVSLGLIACDREQARQGAAPRYLLLCEFLIRRGGERLLRDLIDDVGGNDDNAVAVAHDDVARIYRHAAAADRYIEIARVMHDGARRGRCAPMVRGQSGLEDALGIAQTTIG